MGALTVSCVNNNQWCLPVYNCIHVLAVALFSAWRQDRRDCRKGLIVHRHTRRSEVKLLYVYGCSDSTLSRVSSNQWCLPVCNCIYVLAEWAVYMMSRCNYVGLLLCPSLQKCVELCTCRVLLVQCMCTCSSSKCRHPSGVFLLVLMCFCIWHCRSFMTWIQTSSSYFGSLNWSLNTCW